MLDDVGDVDGVAVDAGLDEGPVEQLARRSDERMAGQVLLVAGLLAQEHQLGSGLAFAEDGLGRVAVQVAGLAGRGGMAELVEVRHMASLPVAAGRSCVTAEGGVPDWPKADAGIVNAADCTCSVTWSTVPIMGSGGTTFLQGGSPAVAAT